MYSPDELLEALRRRMRRSLRPASVPGEFPPGWQEWFASMTERVGAVTGASSEAIVAILKQREPRLRPARLAELNRWQAFSALWRQEWQAPEPEGRRERITAYVVTLVIHLLLAVILVWLSWARMGAMPAPGPQGEIIVQVEYIGEGTPQEVGGGAPSAEVPEPQQVAPSAAAASAAAQPVTQVQPQPAQAAPASPPPSPTVQPEPTPPQPVPPSVAQAQPLVVTQTPQPDSSFTLPPPTPRAVSVPQAQIQVPELQEQVRAIEVVEIPAPAPVKALQPKLPTAQVVVPELQAPTEALPDPQSSLKQVRAREVATAQAQLQVPELSDQVATLPSSRAATADAGQGVDNTQGESPSSTQPTAATGNTPGATATRPGGPPATSDGAATDRQTAGAGPETAAKPGAWPSPKAGDDWGLSDRNRPGGQAGKPGLFDEQGRPRLPPGTRPEVGGGLPPGTIEENIADLDRAGTWLKRPPINYTPTRFDRFWVPSETLLEEWVRRNIREVTIQIPGTSKKLRCVVSLLQLGGGCGISDPNLNNQPASARPPPDIPFKRDLQEDQDALGPPDAKP